MTGEQPGMGAEDIEASADIARTMEAAFAAGFDRGHHVVDMGHVAPAQVEGDGHCQPPRSSVDRRGAWLCIHGTICPGQRCSEQLLDVD